MRLFSHITRREKLPSILDTGLLPNKMGVIYLSPKLEGWRNVQDGEVLLHVMVRQQHITAFTDCANWEVLCWDAIPPQDILICE